MNISNETIAALSDVGKFYRGVLAVRHGPLGDPTYLVEVETDDGLQTGWVREGQAVAGVEWQQVVVSKDDKPEETDTDDAEFQEVIVTTDQGDNEPE